MGPSLFIFYINSVFKLNLKGNIQLYADDVAQVYGKKDSTFLKMTIKSDLKNLKHFFNILCLDINTEKTKYVQFSGRTKLEFFTERSFNICL